MTENNWLETAELERQRHEEAAKIALRLKEARESEVMEHLQPFMALCARVNALWPGSLSLSHLAVDGLLDSRRAKAMVYDGYTVRGHKRGLRMEFDDQSDRIFMSAIISEANIKYPYTHTFLLLPDREVKRHTCTLNDLSTWRETDILKALEWMLLKADSLEGHLPGKPVATKAEVAHRALEERSRRICEIYIRISKGWCADHRLQLLIDGKVETTAIGDWLSERALSCQVTGGTHHVEVRRDDEVASFTITAEVGKTMEFELDRRFFSSRLILKHVSTKPI